ncbi:FUSC family protein [Enterococcus sp. BWM-S5]|uniref:FUSC family protein n=1 Tax=Enterococcus larvae TaxID=2794352 RepID=A0ABS4CRE8_9ENTE|nr:FUSC family protein [Enterococcus larvae]MBP1048354.1 FUSC family protein [Enterococcus larvae]
MTIGPFRLGMRTIKSALAVMICILLFKVFDRGAPMIAALAAVFSLRQDLTTSLSFGKSRIIGNSIGGGLALLYFVVQQYFSNDFLVELLFLPLLVILVIVLSDGIGNNPGIISAIATLLMIALSVPQGESVYYAFERVLDTFIGTFVGISINFLIRAKPVEKKRQIDEDLAELEKKEKELEEMRISVKKRIEEEEHPQ